MLTLLRAQRAQGGRLCWSNSIFEPTGQMDAWARKQLRVRGAVWDRERSVALYFNLGMELSWSPRGRKTARRSGSLGCERTNGGECNGDRRPKTKIIRIIAVALEFRILLRITGMIKRKNAAM